MLINFDSNGGDTDRQTGAQDDIKDGYIQPADN